MPVSFTASAYGLAKRRTKNRMTCFLISALACTRARPAATLALLSHMLMNGFFFSHGFATGRSPC